MRNLIFRVYLRYYLVSRNKVLYYYVWPTEGRGENPVCMQILFTPGFIEFTYYCINMLVSKSLTIVPTEQRPKYDSLGLVCRFLPKLSLPPQYPLTPPRSTSATFSLNPRRIFSVVSVANTNPLNQSVNILLTPLAVFLLNFDAQFFILAMIIFVPTWRRFCSGLHCRGF